MTLVTFPSLLFTLNDWIHERMNEDSLTLWCTKQPYSCWCYDAMLLVHSVKWLVNKDIMGSSQTLGLVGDRMSFVLVQSVKWMMIWRASSSKTKLRIIDMSQEPLTLQEACLFSPHHSGQDRAGFLIFLAYTFLPGQNTDPLQNHSVLPAEQNWTWN